MALVVVFAAQAAPQQKKYSANVHVVGGDVSATAATLRLILTNKTRSQTLGSANFTAPVGVVPTAVVGAANRSGWSATFSGRTVMFRSTSNALPVNESVSADVSVAISQADCGSATWSTAAKQSNDFSGSGNDFQFDPEGSDLTPLGSFAIATIETVTADEQHVPAILTDEAKETNTTAYDVCQNVKATYSGATRSNTLLTGASFDPASGLDWDMGVGTVTITPDVTETDNNLIVSDPTTGISATSNFFDTTDRLCTPADTEPCEWSNQNGRIKAKSDPPPAGASLGIGFNSSLAFSCGGSSAAAGGAVVNINPRYDATNVEAIAVTLTYAKAATPGSASNYDVCFRKDDVLEWSVLSQCGSTTPDPSEANCFISRKRVSGGDLEVVLWIDTDDPWAGLG